MVFGGSDFVADIQSRFSEAKEIGEFPRAQRYPGRKFFFRRRKSRIKKSRNKQIEIATCNMATP